MKALKVDSLIKWSTYDKDGELNQLRGFVTVVYKNSVTIEWNVNPLGFDKTYNVPKSVFSVENGDWSIEG